MPLGPVQLLVVGFERPDFKGDVLAEFARLRDNDVVRVIDLLVVRKDADGSVERLHHSDLPEAEGGGTIVSALIGLDARTTGEAVAAEVPADELWSLDEVIPAGSAAAIALIEHRWAIGARDAIGSAGGALVADAWVHPADLAAAGLVA